MTLRDVIEAFQLKRIKKFPLPLPESSENYGVVRRYRGQMTYFMLAKLATQVIAVISTKELPTTNLVALNEAVLGRNAENVDGLVGFNANILMIKAVFATENVITSLILYRLAEEIIEICAQLANHENAVIFPFPLLSNEYFTGKGPIYSRNHSFSSQFTDETYTVPLSAYQSGRVVHVYSPLCSGSEEAVQSDRWHAFLALCNEQMVPGVFKVIDRNQVIFEICAYNCGDLEGIGGGKVICDLVAKYANCYKDPFTSVIQGLTTGDVPNILRAVTLCKYNLEDMERRSEMPDSDSISSLGKSH